MRRLLKTVPVVLLLLAPLSPLPGSASAEALLPACPWGWIVASRDSGDERAIYGRCGVDGEDVMIADLPGRDIRPVLSPDGLSLVWGNGDTGAWRIWKKDLLTGVVTMVSQRSGELPDDWSTEGRHLAISSSVGGLYNWDVWSADLVTGERVRVTSSGSSGRSTGSARWTPDGTALYYNVESSQDRLDVWRIPAAGGPPERITHFAALGLSATSPRPSPDGQTVAFIVHGNGAARLWLHDVATERSLPTEVVLPFVSGCCPSGLTWSPDGTRMLFSSQDHVVYIIDPFAEVVQPLMQGDGSDWGRGVVPRLEVRCGIVTLPIWCSSGTLPFSLDPIGGAALACEINAIGVACSGNLGTGLANFVVETALPDGSTLTHGFTLGVDPDPPIADRRCGSLLSGSWCSEASVRINAEDTLSGLRELSCARGSAVVPCGDLQARHGDVFTMRGRDRAGNVVEASLSVDQVAPVIDASCGGLTSGDWCGSPIVDILASDALSGIAELSCLRNDATGPCTFADGEDGDRIVVSAADRAGNAVTLSLGIDLMPPVTILTCGSVPAGAWCRDVSLHIDAEDALSGVAARTCERNGVTTTCGQHVAEHGDHFLVRAVDNAGHAAQGSTRIDLRSPDLGMLVEPLEEGVVTLTLYDDGAGVGAWALYEQVEIRTQLGTISTPSGDAVCSGNGAGATQLAHECVVDGIHPRCYVLVAEDVAGNKARLSTASVSDVQVAARSCAASASAPI